MCGQLESLTRVNFFQGQLLTPEDLTAEQEYHRRRLRMHNRYCHGWGIACGLEVGVTNNEVTVTPGLALDCQGEQVVLPAPAALVPAQQSGSAPLFLVISLTEELIEPVPVSGEMLAYRRVLEGSRLELSAQDPTENHTRGRGRSEPCGETHGVPLARLRWVRGRWRVDRRYRRRRVR